MYETKLRWAIVFCALLGASAGCGDEEVKERTRSVKVTATIPANPTTPILIQTDDPESEVDVTLPVEALEAIIEAAGGPVQVTMTDMAPTDYDTLPASERALVEQNPSLATLLFDIVPISALSPGEVSSGSGSLRAQQAEQANPRAFFKVKNRSGRRCTPGVVDFYQIFGANSTRLPSTIVIDDESPLQNIQGESSDIAFEVLHFIFCFECPRVTPTASTGGT